MTNNSSNRTSVPEAKEALNKFKYEVASELRCWCYRGNEILLTLAIRN